MSKIKPTNNRIRRQEQNRNIRGGSQGKTEVRGCRVANDCGLGYTGGMKTAISIPDPIFREAERLARRLKKSRSQLYAEAMADYLRRHDPDAVTEALNRVCAES